jgi:hypothetical protein
MQKGGSYAIRFSICTIPTNEMTELQCAKLIAAIAWGSEGALSELLQQQIIEQYVREKLEQKEVLKVAVITSRAAQPSKNAPTLRMSITCIYYLPAGHDRGDDINDIFKRLFQGKSTVVIRGITFAVFPTPQEAMRRPASSKSFGICNILSISGLSLEPSIDDVVGVLIRSCAVVCNDAAWVFSLRNVSAKGKDLRYVIVLGAVQVGRYSIADPVFKGISTTSISGYDIRIEAGELFEQAELRQTYKPAATKALPAPTSASALVSSKKGKPQVAWEPSTLATYSPADTSSPTQLASNILAAHTSDIKKLFDTVDALNVKIDKQAASAITLDQIRALLRE